MKRKDYACLLMIGFLVLLLADMYFFYMEYENYQNKMDILYIMLSDQDKEEDTLSLVTGILKGNKKEVLQEAKEQLEQYGYFKGYQNIYKKVMYNHYAMILGLSCIIYVLYLCLLFYLSYQSKKRRNEELYKLQENITRLRDGNFDLSPLNQVKGSDDIIKRLQMDLESLSSHIKLIMQQAKTEKEKTKSLVTDISHQLKTPTAALKTSFDILENQDLTQEEKKEFETRCREQIKRLNELVAALINISRMESGMIEIHREAGCIFDTVISAINRIYPQAEEKQIELSLEAEKELESLMLLHDSKWLAEAIINILENAVKYSPNNTSVIIRLIKMTVFLRIEIEDEGIGIKRQERNKIFKRFYRGESDIVKQKTGSGIGLYLARQIIECHYGTISAAAPRNNTARKQGSLFILQIPL